MKLLSKSNPTRLSVGMLSLLGVAVAVNAMIALLPVSRSIALGLATNHQRSTSQESFTLLSAEATTPGVNSPPLDAQKTRSPAPWSKPPLNASEVPWVFLNEWRQVGNRGSTCAAIASTNLGEGQGAKPRPANFGAGAWAIAYDRPGLPGRNPDGSFCANCGRGAFGIAGTSSYTDQSRYQGWTLHREWADGSRADYGLTGGDSLPYLAYLEISGQRCLYNIWSFLGREHLEYLLAHLRFIKGAP